MLATHFNEPMQDSRPMAKPLFAPDEQAGRGKLLIADDHALLRYGLRSLLGAQAGDIDIIESNCLSDATQAYRHGTGIDLVLLNLNMCDCRGLQGLQQFIQAFPAARVAVMSTTQDAFVIKQALGLGAVGHIAKTLDPADLTKMILDLLHSGKAACLPSTSQVDTSGNASPVTGQRANSNLKRRHLEILDLILFGCSNQEISRATGLTVGTVKNYITGILQELDVKSRSHLISVFR